ncbi:MAG: DUF2922 domain-containing protein [Clostridia bacterium]|jgi:hypothetical protein
MELKQVLEMVFKTGEGRTFRLTLDSPREDVTPAEIQAAMNLILTKNIFNIEGGLTEIVEANIIDTQVNPVVFV